MTDNPPWGLTQLGFEPTTSGSWTEHLIKVVVYSPVIHDYACSTDITFSLARRVPMQPATINPALDLCTRYPLRLGGPRQCWIRSLPDTSTYDICIWHLTWHLTWHVTWQMTSDMTSDMTSGNRTDHWGIRDPVGYLVCSPMPPAQVTTTYKQYIQQFTKFCKLPVKSNC